MELSYGTQMHSALLAVSRMHQGCSKLLQDLDRALPTYKSLLRNVVTSDTSQDIKTGRYMAEGLHRLYGRGDQATEVVALNLCFLDVNEGFFDVPTLIAARLTYAAPALTSQELLNRAWHPWQAFVENGDRGAFRVPIIRDGSFEAGTVIRVSLQAAPLFDFSTSAQVIDFIALVAPEVKTHEA